MQLLFLSCLVGLTAAFTEASTTFEKRDLNQKSRRAFPDPGAYPDPFDAKLMRESENGPHDDLMLLRREDGGFDLITRAQHANITSTLQQPPPLSKRWAFPNTICEEASDGVPGHIPQCTYRPEKAHCIDEEIYEVTCAGCFNHDKQKNLKKPFKNSCHANMKCIDTMFINDWKEEEKFIACMPKKETLVWHASALLGSPDHSWYCSPGLNNFSGVWQNAELHLGVYDDKNKNPIAPAASRFVYNGKSLGTFYHSILASTSVVMANRASAQACIKPDFAMKQVLTGRFAVEFLDQK